MPERYDHFINGQYVAPVEGAYFESTNPATLETLYSAARGTTADVDAAVQAANRPFGFKRGLACFARSGGPRLRAVLVADSCRSFGTLWRPCASSR